MREAERLACLRLIRSENVGPVTFRELINHFGGAEAALAALPELSRRGGSGARSGSARASEAEAELERAHAQPAPSRCSRSSRGYPAPLAALDAPPPLLYVKGDRGLLNRPTVAVVGSRQCSAAGAKLARQFAIELGRAGYVVVSGLARGIDSVAHEAALEQRHGRGARRRHRHRLSARARGAAGARSASAAASSPRCRSASSRAARTFPRRNRIISGLSLGVLIVEAARRSGTLVTARLAAEQGREVFAVPGHPLDPRAEGTNKLLKSGATLVTEADDVLSALTPADARGRRRSCATKDRREPAARRLPPTAVATATATASSPRSGRRRSTSTRSCAAPGSPSAPCRSP